MEAAQPLDLWLARARGAPSRLDWALAAGAQVDFFALPRLSIFAQAGARLLFQGGGHPETALGSSGSVSRTLFDIGPRDAAAILGFTWWL